MKNHTYSKLLILLFVMLIASVSFASAQYADKESESAEESFEGISEEEIKEMYEMIEHYKDIPEIIINAPYTYSLVLANESRKKIILESIQFMPINESEKEEMSETIKDIWSRVPDRITEDDYESLQKIGDDVIKYNMMGYATSPVSTQYYSLPKNETPEEQRTRIQEEIDLFGIEGLTVDDVVELEDRINTRRNLPDVVKNAPGLYLISSPEKNHEGYLKHIDGMSISSEEKERMKADLEDLWARYPDEITEEDYPRIREITSAIEKYVDETYFKKYISERNKTSSPKWYGSTHGDLIYYACMRVLNNQTFANNAKIHADDPDENGFDHCVFIYKSGNITLIYNASDSFSRHYNHIYNPTLNITVGSQLYYGGAAGECAKYSNNSLNEYSTGQYSSSSTYLGYASHYISDIGNPMHTGNLANQLLDSLDAIYENIMMGNYPILSWNNFWNDFLSYTYMCSIDTSHIVYENYVDDNWSVGYAYRDYVSNNTYSIYISNPEQSVIELSDESNSYLDDLWDAVHSNPQTFGSNPDVRFITTHMIQKTARYNVGLVQYITTANRSQKVTYVSNNLVFATDYFTGNNFTVSGIHPIYNEAVFFQWSDGLGNYYYRTLTYSANGSMILQAVSYDILIDFYPDPMDNVREVAHYIANSRYNSYYDIDQDGDLDILDLGLLYQYVNEHY